MELKNKQLKTGDKSHLPERISKLIDWLDEITEEYPDVCISAGDVFGYICGYSTIDGLPEDEIEILE